MVINDVTNPNTSSPPHTALHYTQKHWKNGHKKECVPFDEQAKLDPEEEVLRAAAPDQFKVRCSVVRNAPHHTIHHSTQPHTSQCPISLEIIEDGVVAADGRTYERAAIEKWFADGNNTSPVMNEPMEHQHLTPVKGWGRSCGHCWFYYFL